MLQNSNKQHKLVEAKQFLQIVEQRLLDIADKSVGKFVVIKKSANVLLKHGLLLGKLERREHFCIKSVQGAEMNNFIERLYSKTILITGASRFLGFYLGDRLNKHSHKVDTISRQLHTSDTRNLHWWQSKLENLETVKKLLLTIKPNLLFHLFGNVTGAAGWNINQGNPYIKLFPLLSSSYEKISFPI